MPSITPSYNTSTGERRTGLKAWLAQKLGVKIFDRFIAPGIEHTRSTLLGISTYGSGALVIAYLDSGKQFVSIASALVKTLVNGADHPGTLSTTAVYSLGLCLVAIIKAWFTHDAINIENAGIPTMPRA